MSDPGNTTPSGPAEAGPARGVGTGSASPEFRAASRRQLVEQARMHGVRSSAVLAAIGRVPRELFVPEELVESAFADRPLPIGKGQTISQPAMVALMAEAARIGVDDHVLEIGSGSGYGAAVLRALAGRVTTVERIEELADRAREALGRCGFGDVDVVVGDGTLGWPEKAPYDAIVVTAAGPSAPPPLVEQLADCGRLVMPVGAEHRGQHLMRLTRQRSRQGPPRQRSGGSESTGRELPGKRVSDHGSRRSEGGRSEPGVCEGVCEERLMPVRFVPLIGVHGF